MNILLTAGALIVAGSVLAVTQIPAETKPDIFTFLFKVGLTGLFYVLFRIFTFRIGKMPTQMVAQAATTAGAELQPK